MCSRPNAKSLLGKSGTVYYTFENSELRDAEKRQGKNEMVSSNKAAKYEFVWHPQKEEVTINFQARKG